MPRLQPQILAVLLCLAIVLMWIDSHHAWLQSWRYGLNYLLTPSQQVAQIPLAVSQWLSEESIQKQELLKENQRLQARNLVLELHSQHLLTLEVENAELRKLLNASTLVDDRVLVAQVSAINPDPYSQQLFINKGSSDGVFVGQPVLDAYGLLGQVIDVMPLSARVLMIADANNAVPVQVNRNGVRAIAQGNGSLSELDLIYVPTTADIVPGDLLVSSGLGERYPKGYPVATVSSVENIPGQPFAKVLAEPSAKLDRSQFLLLVFNQGANRIPPEELWRGQ